jgi:hypothetical protein
MSVMGLASAQGWCDSGDGLSRQFLFGYQLELPELSVAEMDRNPVM